MGSGVHPAFNARKEALRAGTIPVHSVRWLLDGICRDPRLLATAGINDLFEARYQVFGARQYKHIAVIIARQALLGFARDAWNGQLPAQANDPIAIAGAVFQRQFGPKAVAARGNGQRNGVIPCAAEEVRLERLADAFDSPAPFGEAQSVLRAARCVAHLKTPLYTE